MFTIEKDTPQSSSPKGHHTSEAGPLDSTELSLASMDGQSYTLDHTYATTSTTTQDHSITSMMDTEQLVNTCAEHNVLILIL